MSAGDLIESLITFTTRVAFAGMAPKDPGPSQHDSRQGAWQRELARAQSAARVPQGTNGRDALASLSVAFDPLLMKATPADRATGAASAREHEAGQRQAKNDAEASRHQRSDVHSHARTSAHPSRDGGHAPSAFARSRETPSPGDAASMVTTPKTLDKPADSAAGDANGWTLSTALARASSGDATSVAAHEAPLVLPFPIDTPTARMAMHGWATAANGGAMPDPGAPDAATTATAADATDAAATSAARVRDAIAGALQEHAPIRLHVQWSAAGARVWIGLDADSTASAAQIVDSVSHWIGRAGARLRSVVCNGVDMSLRATDGTPPSIALPFPIDLLVERNPSWPPSAP